MPFGGQLRAETAAGAALVDAAGRFAAEFATGALAHDRDGTFAVEHLAKLRADGFLVAPVPTEFGGAGVTGVRDVLVAASRLARGDPSTGLGVNMHLAGLLGLVRSWRTALARGDEPATSRLGATLRHMVEADVVLAAAISEPPPQDLTRPTTTATRVPEGWVINGRKAFATMAPHATMLNVAVTFTDERGAQRYGFASVPPSSQGVVCHDDWDALGMRASASGSVSFHDVAVDASGLRDGFTAGSWSGPMLERFLLAGAFHASVSLGIAEAAHAWVVTRLQARADDAMADPHVVTELAGNVVDVEAMRGCFDRAARVIDAHHAAFPTGEPPQAATQAVFGEVQAAKAFLNVAGVRVVDRALALSGGAGYRAADPLAKAWRDVRACAFLHPLGANRAGSFLARTALGLPPRDRPDDAVIPPS